MKMIVTGLHIGRWTVFEHATSPAGLIVCVRLFGWTVYLRAGSYHRLLWWTW